MSQVQINYFLNTNLRHKFEQGLLKQSHFTEEQVLNMTDYELVNLYYYYYPTEEKENEFL